MSVAAYRVLSTIVLPCLLAAMTTAANAQFVFVGPASDPDCDFHTIQDAIDAWAASPSADFVDVYVANAQAWPATALNVPTPVASAGIGLHGDYPACHLGGTQGLAHLDGTGNGGVPVLDINGSIAGDGRRFQVNIGGFEISGGVNAGGNGGGARVRGNVSVTFADDDVHDNSAGNGGGISVEATAAGVPQLILVGSRLAMTVRDNQATQDGGGYYCENASIYCDRYCLIEGNDAGRNGGGVAQQACQTAIYTSPSTASDPHVGLRTNTAVGDGGGAWSSGGYFVIGGDAPSRPAPVVGNAAGGSGGGIFVTGVGSSSLVYRGVQFDDNSAGGNGGALSIDSGFIQAYTALSGACAGDIDGCARFKGNHADGAGGAIALSGTANLLMNDTMFAGNDAGSASVMQLGTTGFAVLTNVHVAGNHGATELVRSAGQGLDLRYVTIADNGSDDSALIRYDAPATFAASNSILYDANGAGSGIVLDAASGTTYFVDCVLVHDVNGIGGQAGVTNLVSADPQWDTGGNYPAGLYVPGADSPAVDACGAGTGSIPDLLGAARPSDLPKPDGVGPYDMGAIERQPDIIFADGFEQG